MAVRRQFLYFSFVGILGFIVDASVLYLVMKYLGAGLYSGRILSYIAAATATWALNRRFTFNTHHNSNLLSEWFKFLSANSVGGGVNYFTYMILVTVSTFVSTWPIIGVAMGSISGLIVNFNLSRRFVFAKQKSMTKDE